MHQGLPDNACGCICRLLNFDDRKQGQSSAEQFKDAEQNKLSRNSSEKELGPNMSLAYRDDEVERQNFANEATLRYKLCQSLNWRFI